MMFQNLKKLYFNSDKLIEGTKRDHNTNIQDLTF